MAKALSLDNLATLENNIFNHNLVNFSIILNESYLNDEQFTENQHMEFMEKMFKKDVRSEEINELVNFLVCSCRECIYCPPA